jgi:preprotein translocase subunit SecA
MRIFAKDWVTNVLKRLGMEEGMSLEHGFLSRGIEKAQKKVEEHNFMIRKNLLDYDEVMDKQRKVFYGRRQAILEAAGLRPTVWNVLLETVDWKLQDTLADGYSLAQIAEWARRTLDVNVKPAALRGRSADELETYLKDRAAQDAQDKVSETIGEFTEAPDDDQPLPADGEEPADVETEVKPQLDYRALAAWARDRLGLALSERDLKQMSDAQIDETLRQAAAEKVLAIDCAALRQFLDLDYPLRVLADWLKLKFNLDLPLDSLRDRPADQIQATLAAALSALYDAKEREYPIVHHMEAALNRQTAAGGFDFDGLARWASWYYCLPVTPDELRLENFDQTRRRLLEVADRSASENALAATIDRGLAAYLAADDAAPTDHNLHAIRHWAAETLGVELTPDELRATTRKPLAETLLQKAREARRCDMNNLERYLLLQVYDTSWKDHLYIMDHLKAGVGLRGYAQIDPKIEYKREGLKQFETMLDGINEKFTDLFFKTRSVQREALNRIWSGQSAAHEEIDPTLAKFDAQKQAALEATQAQALEKPKPIIRVGPKIGRNDPCSCGSGKKFKNCCGRN